MRSPFPGMDPHLENPGRWAGVHDGLITGIRADLNRKLGPGYVADIGTSVYIIGPAEQRWVFPDIYVAESRRPECGFANVAVRSPVQVLLKVPETISQTFVQILDLASRQVVAVIEILSPINKAPADTRARADFLRQRAEVFGLGSH